MALLTCTFLEEVLECALRKSMFIKSSIQELTNVHSLAYAELYLALAVIVRRFTLTPFDTDLLDIECVCDAFFLMPK